ARGAAELAADLLGRLDRAHDRVPGDGAEISADLARRADRPADRRDRSGPHLAADVARARDRRDERVLDEVHDADGDGPASADGPLNRLLEASVAAAARRSRAVPRRSAGLPLPRCSCCSPLGFHPVTSCARPFPYSLASDASLRLSARTAAAHAPPPAPPHP